MKIKLLQTISNTFSEDMELESTYTTELFSIFPDTGKMLKNTKTGELYRSPVCVNKKSSIKNYIELDDPNVIKKELSETL